MHKKGNETLHGLTFMYRYFFTFYCGMREASTGQEKLRNLREADE